MKKIVFFILLATAFSCKKKEDVKPVKTDTLKVIYRSEDPTGMNVWCTTTNAFYFNEHKSTAEYIFTETVKSGQNIQASVSSPSGYWKTMIVIFGSDTLYNKKMMTNHSCNIDF